MQKIKTTFHTAITHRRNIQKTCAMNLYTKRKHHQGHWTCDIWGTEGSAVMWHYVVGQFLTTQHWICDIWGGVMWHCVVEQFLTTQRNITVLEW